MFEGSYVALVTPFAGGKVDLKKLRALVEFQLENGTQGLVPIGTTGEAPTLSDEEKADIIRAVVKAARGRVPVMAGTGTYDTRASIALTKMARDLGADAALLVSPYYNKPTQEGLYRHYEAIAKAVDLPLCLYNIPGRTGVNIAPETVARIAKLKNVRAIKEGSGNIEQVTQIRALCSLKVLSGDDSLTWPILCLGGSGVISVAANIVPSAIAETCEAAAKGDLARARQLHDRHYELFKALFIETNPIPIKTAMKMMGMIGGDLRLPLSEMSDSNAARLKATLRRYELL